MMKKKPFLALLTLLAGLPLLWAAATPLDDYVNAPDPAFAYDKEPAKTVADDAYTAKVYKMTSQAWREPSEVDRTKWEHWVTICVPKEAQGDTAMMFVGGGGNKEEAPDPEGQICGVAVATKSILVSVGQIPNQPLHFADEKDDRYKEKGRVEDELITYGWDKFLSTGDPTWLPRLPMTKAVVRAMDLVQQELPNVKKFVVVGGSKRGWTTWTTAAVDKRVVGMVPAVIDCANFEHSVQHQHDVYGFWGEAVSDYVDMNILQRVHTPEMRKLLAIVDPYTYFERYTMPKYIMCASGDQFFLPDSAQWYFPALKGEKYLRYVPNADHGLNAEAYMNLASFHHAVINNTPRPEFSWTRDAAGAFRVVCKTKPTAVRFWSAANEKARDFRKATIGEAWQSLPLEDQGDGVYVAVPPVPGKGWLAYFVELEFPNPAFPSPFKFTTEVNVLPQFVPFRNPGGSGSIEFVGEGTDRLTLVHLRGGRYEMGYWYGRLLAEQIGLTWKRLNAEFNVPDEVISAAADALWNPEYFDTVAWEAELRGIEAGCMDAGHPEVDYALLRKLLAVPDLSESGCSLFAAWGKATKGGDTYQMRNLDWTMTAGVQQWPVVVIYEPTDGQRHMLAGFAGMLGAVVGGMNASGLAVSEIQGHFGDAETLKGIPFPVLLRDALYYDKTLDEALTRMRTATRTNQYHYAIADPAAPDPKARLLFTSNTRFDELTDEQVCTKHPVVDPTPFYEKLDDALYWRKHNGGGNEELFKAIKERYGAIDAEKAIEIAKVAGVDGTLASIIYENSKRVMWVAFAEGEVPAHKQGYVRIDLNDGAKAPSAKSAGKE